MSELFSAKESFPFSAEHADNNRIVETDLNLSAIFFNNANLFSSFQDNRACALPASNEFLHTGESSIDNNKSLVDAIKQSNDNLKDFIHEMIAYWIKNHPGQSYPSWWDEILSEAPQNTNASSPIIEVGERANYHARSGGGYGEVSNGSSGSGYHCGDNVGKIPFSSSNEKPVFSESSGSHAPPAGAFGQRLAQAIKNWDERMPGTGACAAAVQKALADVNMAQFAGCGNAWEMLGPLQRSGLFVQIPESEATVGDLILRPPSANPNDNSIYGDISVVTARQGNTIIQTNDASYEFERNNPRYDGKAVFLRYTGERKTS